MKKHKIIEAWRNEESYFNLSDEEKAAMPAHPSGPASVEDEILRSVTGGCGTKGTPCTTYCTTGYCF